MISSLAQRILIELNQVKLVSFNHSGCKLVNENHKEIG